MAAVLRLGVGERGVTEIMAISEHVSSLCADIKLRDDASVPGPRPISAGQLSVAAGAQATPGS